MSTSESIDLDLAGARGLLAAHAPAFADLTMLLMVENEKMNLTRIDTPELLERRHYLDSLAAVAAAEALGLGAALRAADVGSGAGFPVLPLAIVRPRWRFVSLEATWKKCHFQEVAASRLGLENVRVVQGRAEEAGHAPEYREQFDLVTARALAPMRVLAELGLGLVRPGGMLLAWKGPSAREELAEARAAIETLGGGRATLLRYSRTEGDDGPKGAASGDFYLVAVPKERPAPQEYPRSYGRIKSKPL
jgi:16S rRNA (guanine527-N7)-methyltransferase